MGFIARINLGEARWYPLINLTQLFSNANFDPIVWYDSVTEINYVRNKYH